MKPAPNPLGKPRLAETDRILELMREVLLGSVEGFVFSPSEGNAQAVAQKLESIRHRYPEYKAVHSRVLVTPMEDGGTVVMFLGPERKTKA